jgi:hypothetical protein
VYSQAPYNQAQTYNQAPTPLDEQVKPFGRSQPPADDQPRTYGRARPPAEDQSVFTRPSTPLDDRAAPRAAPPAPDQFDERTMAYGHAPPAEQQNPKNPQNPQHGRPQPDQPQPGQPQPGQPHYGQPQHGQPQPGQYSGQPQSGQQPGQQQSGRPQPDRQSGQPAHGWPQQGQQGRQPGQNASHAAGPQAGQQPGQQQGQQQGQLQEQARPGANLSRDPSDPEHRFVTAGQISGSRTPPPERQQELWNTVFGEGYQGDGDSLEETGRPIWIYALAGSVAIALIVAILWAFLAGPLAGEDPAQSNVPTTAPSASPKASASRQSTTIPRLRAYPGKAAPVTGTVADATAGISVPRLGGTWRVDTRPTVKGTYGFDTRQYAMLGDNLAAQLLTGPLSPKLASFYTSKTDLEPVIKQVVLNARKRFFPAGNTVRKIAQQNIKVGDSTGRVVAYSLSSTTQKATIVTIAVNTGNSVPAIVYLSVPSEGKALLPDINTVVKQLKVTTP